LPLVVWQGSACVAAAFSHLPFQNLNARRYSWVCMGVAGLQIAALLVAFPLGIQLAAESFINWFACISSIGLLAMCYWLSHMRKDNLLFDK
jgi:ABC-type transport system involved in cytochrome c biogenesis permease subunit